MPVIPTLRSQKQRDQVLKVILGCKIKASLGHLKPYPKKLH